MPEPGPGSSSDRSTEPGRYCLHGVCIRSDVPLPGWPPAHDVRRNEWRVEIDDVGAQLRAAGLVRAGIPQWWWTGDPAVAEGRPTLTLTGGSADGSATTFEIDWDDLEIRIAFTHAERDGLRGSLEILNRWILPVIGRHESQLVPLHATSISTVQGALVVAGESGAGKSTLVAALCELGGILLGDEPVAVEPSGGMIRVWPGEPVVRLLDDSSRQLRSLPGMQDAGRRFGKSVTSSDRDVDGTMPIPLAAICLLGPRLGQDEAPVFEAVTGAAAITALMGQRYSGFGLAALVRRDFTVVSRVAETAVVIRAHLPHELDRLHESASQLTEAVARAVRSRGMPS